MPRSSRPPTAAHLPRERTPISIRLPKDLKKFVDERAREARWPTSWLIIDVLTKWRSWWQQQQTKGKK